METALSELLAGMEGVSAENKDVLCQAFALADDSLSLALARAEQAEGRAEEAESRAREAKSRADRAEIDAALWRSPFLNDDVPDQVHRAFIREHFRGCFAVEDGRIVGRDPRTGEVIIGEDGENPAPLDDALRLLVALHPNGHLMIRRRPNPMEATHYTPPAEKKKRPRMTSTSSTGEARRSCPAPCLRR